MTQAVNIHTHTHTHSQCSQSNAVLETVSRPVPLRSYRFDSFQRPVWFASNRMIFYIVPVFAHTVQNGANNSRHVQKSSRHVKNTILDSFVNLILICDFSTVMLGHEYHHDLSGKKRISHIACKSFMKNIIYE